MSLKEWLALNAVAIAVTTLFAVPFFALNFLLPDDLAPIFRPMLAFLAFAGPTAALCWIAHAFYGQR